MGASPVVEYHNATYTIHNVAISFCFLSHHISTDVVEILLSISREIHIARYLDSAGYGMQTECSGISRGLRIEFRGIFFFCRPVTRHCVIRYFYSGNTPGNKTARRACNIRRARIVRPYDRSLESIGRGSWRPRNGPD